VGTGKFFPATFVINGKKLCLPQNSKVKDANFNTIDKEHFASLFANSVSTLFIISMERLQAVPMINSWKVPFLKEFPNHNVVELMLIERIPLMIFHRLLVYYNKKTIDPQYQNRFLFTNGFFFPYKREYNIINRYSCFPFLLDSKCEIKWRACGEASPDELRVLFEYNHSLMQQEKFHQMTLRPSERKNLRSTQKLN